MFVCLDCQRTFEEPARWKEGRGEHFGYPSYEQYSGCPYCGGAYTETYKCDCCDEWIEGEYIKIDGDRYCEHCYDKYEIGEE